MTVASTNIPGRRKPSAFGNVARHRTLRVVAIDLRTDRGEFSYLDIIGRGIRSHLDCLPDRQPGQVLLRHPEVHVDRFKGLDRHDGLTAADELARDRPARMPSRPANGARTVFFAISGLHIAHLGLRALLGGQGRIEVCLRIRS